MRSPREERVTRFPVRDVALPGGAGTLALITMDNGLDHTAPTTFGPQGLANLAASLDQVSARAQAGEIVAVGLTGKPFVFAAGADLTDVGRLATREQALAVARLGHTQLRRFGELAVPSFAFVNGAALGGGLEIALHCTYRTISSAVTALALPEVLLGLVPGWGGAHLLPNLVGVDAALTVIIENAMSQNRMLTGAKAHAMGIADAIFEPADFLVQSLRWAAEVLTGERTVTGPDVERDEGAWTSALARARAFADAKVAGACPAPYRALDLVALARTADRDAGFAAEDQALADLIMSEEFRASVYAFTLVQRRAKRPAAAPDQGLARPVTKVGVVGAGLMARQLALLFVQRLKVPVVLNDLDDARVATGVGEVHAQIAGLHAKGRLGPDQAARLTALVTGSTSLTDFADADLVIEAVFEDTVVKAQVFADLENVVPPDCLLATNTSALSVTAMAASLRRPQRLVGLHFFNPVAVLPLLEVVRAERTDDAALATALAVGVQLRKTCVLVKDAPGFVVNRLLTRLLGEVMHALDGGTALEVTERALAPLGLPMTPLALLQLVGPAVALHVAETLHEAFPDRYRVSPTLQRLVAAGRPGFYAPDAGGRPRVDEQALRLLPQGTPGADADADAERLRATVLRALAQEIGLMLDEGVVAQPQDVDVCLLLGAGWPFHLGGITPYLDRTGVSEQVTGRRFLEPGVASLGR